MTAPLCPRFPITLFLFVLSLGGLYARSYWRADAIGIFVSDGRLQAISSSHGRFLLAVTNLPFGDARRWTWDYTSGPTAEMDEKWQDLTDAAVGATPRAPLPLPFRSSNAGSGGGGAPASTPGVVIYSGGIAHITERAGFTLGLTRVNAIPTFKGWIQFAAVPQWVATPLVLMLIVQIRNWRRSSVRSRRGLCQYCGYDLRGSAGRCPECGNEAAAKKPA